MFGTIAVAHECCEETVYQICGVVFAEAISFITGVASVVI
jgi:hypothetical protein